MASSSLSSISQQQQQQQQQRYSDNPAADSSNYDHHHAHHGPLLKALMKHKVQAEVCDLDHYRIHGGMAVETDYIVSVLPSGGESDSAGKQKKKNADEEEEEEEQFDSFLLSKTYAAFRSFAQQLKAASDAYTNHKNVHHQAKLSLPPEVVKVAQLCEVVTHLVESQKQNYWGKVNYMYVKVLAKQRSQIVNDVLEATIQNFPENVNAHPLLQDIAAIVETFFLTDHCEESSLCSAPSTGMGPAVAAAAAAAISTPLRALKEQGRKLSNVTTGGGSTGGGGGAPTEVKVKTTTTPSKQQHHDAPPLQQEPPGAPPSSLTMNSAGSGGGGFTTPPRKTREEGTTPASHMSSASSMNTTGSRRDGLQRRSSAVVPITRRNRRSEKTREADEEELKAAGGDANLVIDGSHTTTGKSARLGMRGVKHKNTPDYRRPKSTTAGLARAFGLVDNNPAVFVVIAAMLVYVLRTCAMDRTVTVDVDVACLVLFACFCLGLHTPRPYLRGYDSPAVMKATVASTKKLVRGGSGGIPSLKRQDVSGRRLLRRSIASLDTGSGADGPTSPAGAAAAAGGGGAAGAAGAGGGRANLDANSAALAASIVQAEINEDELEIDDDQDVVGKSPMAMFPAGAKIGSVMNCWSEPFYDDFKVRGPQYLSDHKKVASAAFIFPNRGVDLFLTDTCPENVGSISGVFGGHLRDKPTFMINFRLPWGVLIFYYEIPERFLPYLKAGYEVDTTKETKQKLNKSLASMSSAGDRTVCRFLMGDLNYKNETLKIVPMVIDGPWVVRSVVGGKPAIVGTKLPINYVYQPASGPNKACYLEADLDIAASSAARGILSVTRTYTNILTIDLGFVVQGNKADELPEQMLTGTRLHGIDPLTAPPLPPVKDIFMGVGAGFGTGDDYDDETMRGGDDTIAQAQVMKRY